MRRVPTRQSWRVFAVLLAGALVAAALASGQLAAWADAHAGRPGGEAVAAALHRWDDLVRPLNIPRDWLRGRMRRAVDDRF